MTLFSGNSGDLVRTSFLAWLTNAEADREESYRIYREYYDGDHATQLTDRMRRYLQVKGNIDFRSNYCPIVVDSLVERLSITGFTSESIEDTRLWDWWTINRMDALQEVVHRGAVRDGDAYLIVGWDTEKGCPRFSFEPAFDGGEGVKVIYDDATRQPKVASKRWRTNSGEEAGYVRRMNVYYPDRIEKFVSNERDHSGQWQAFVEEGRPWPLPWVDARGQALGLPVIHFRNNDQGYNYGQSELKDIVPLQNALNKTMIDLIAAADTTAFRIYWMVGDDPSAVQVAPGSWIYTRRPPAGENGAALGFFPGEDLGNLIALKDSIAIEIARVSRTPVSYFQVSGQRPAEGTLQQEESGLVGKARARQIVFGNAWEDALRLARRLWNVFGAGEQMDEQVAISASWRDPETRNAKTLLETLIMKLALGVPKEQLWAEMGYNADDLALMREMLLAEETRAQSVGESLITAFERGGRQTQGGTPGVPISVGVTPPPEGINA